MLRDGTITYVDVFRPETSGKFPALLQRTPYDKQSPNSRSTPLDAIRAANSGYVVVIQDVRGRYSSGGEFYPFVDEITDGYDSVEWVASQSWCNGRVGMYGASYVGATQWLAAKANPPSLCAIAPGVTASDYHEGWAWHGGAFELGFNLSWTLGSLTSANWDNLANRLYLSPRELEILIQAKDNLLESLKYLPLQELPDLQGGIAPYYFDWIDHPEYDEYWKAISVRESHGDISIPAFNYGGWYDIFLSGTIENFTNMRDNGASDSSREGQRLVIGPWDHSSIGDHVVGEVGFGSNASFNYGLDLQDEILRFFDYWLRDADNGIADDKPVNIFIMGENVWRKEDEWPLSRSDNVQYFMRSGGKANSFGGDGWLDQASPGNSDPPDVYLYNPLDPVPTRGGSVVCDLGVVPAGAYDQSQIESRDDVLVYTTAPLKQYLEVTGPVTVTLYASSSAQDTDFTAKLVDVSPDGYAKNLTDGIVRARYREDRQRPDLIEPENVYEYRIDLWATSNLFKAGHSIRLEISSSNFPKYDRNANSGDPIGSDRTVSPALQTVYHNTSYPSHLTLPVVPRD